MSPFVEKWRHRLLHRMLPLSLVLVGVVLLRDIGSGHPGIVESPTLGLGLLLVGAFIGGKSTATVGLPRITGYLLLGALVGPHTTGIVSAEMLQAGKAVEGLAVALIALTAGGELRIPWIRRYARRLTLITFSELTVVALVVGSVVLLARSLFPFMPADDLGTSAVIAMVFGAIAVANSPTVTIAVIAETGADGPVAQTALGVTILKDVAVIVLFAVALTVARDALGAGGASSLGLTLLRELGGSILAGVGFGVGIGLFLRLIPREVPVFVLAACFAMWQVSTALHLETLLVALTAGFWVENFSKASGDALIKGIGRLALPVYALFFAAAGAKVDFATLATLWPLALMLTIVRGAGVWAGTRLGTTLAKTEPEVRRYVWLGFISQAGVSLALATIVARSFPTWGNDLQALIVAMIAMHELIGPILFQWALRRAGEAGTRAAAATAPPVGSPH